MLYFLGEFGQIRKGEGCMNRLRIFVGVKKVMSK